jgi:hypothetical protein
MSFFIQFSECTLKLQAFLLQYHVRQRPESPLLKWSRQTFSGIVVLLRCDLPEFTEVTRYSSKPILHSRVIVEYCNKVGLGLGRSSS